MMTLSEVAEKFEVSVPAMLGYVRRNLEEINSDGNHAYKHKGDWQFDEVAVERIAKMREASKAELWSNKVKLRKLTKAQKLDLENLQSAFSDLQEKVTTLEMQLKTLQEAEVQKSALSVDVSAKSVADEQRDEKIASLEIQVAEVSRRISREMNERFDKQFDNIFVAKLEGAWNDASEEIKGNIRHLDDVKPSRQEFFEELNKLDKKLDEKFTERIEKSKDTPTNWFWLLLIVQIIFFLVLFLKS